MSTNFYHFAKTACGTHETFLVHQNQLSESVCPLLPILLGPDEDQLRTESHCEPRDISENSETKILACLYDSDLCNSSPGSKYKLKETRKYEK